MEFRVLRYFLAVAREKSMTGAANVLHVTQPTLSRQIRDLEDELGTQLFERHSHSVTLTADGMRLRKRAEEMEELWELTREEFAAAKSGIEGDIRIGAGETLAMRHLAGVISEIREMYPDIRVHLYSGNMEDLSERLDRGLLDFGVLIQPADLSKYSFVHLPEKDVWGVVTRRDSHLAAKTIITREDLAGLPLILSRQAMRPQAGNVFLEWFGDEADRLNVVATFNLVYNAAILVEAGIGHVVTLRGLANTSESSLLCFRLLDPVLETGLSIVWKKQQLFSPAAEVFWKRIMERFGGRAWSGKQDNGMLFENTTI